MTADETRAWATRPGPGEAAGLELAGLRAAVASHAGALDAVARDLDDGGLHGDARRVRREADGLRAAAEHTEA